MISLPPARLLSNCCRIRKKGATVPLGTAKGHVRVPQRTSAALYPDMSQSAKCTASNHFHLFFFAMAFARLLMAKVKFGLSLMARS